MPTYAIGDLQGCFEPLQRLLDKIDFNPKKDTLWFAGDLINRGPQSLDCLRFVKSLRERAVTVLGNHDLHLLAVYYTFKPTKKGDTLDEILNAEDGEELLFWLRQQPLVHHDAERNWFMSHAGIPPMWSVDETVSFANEVHQALLIDHLELFRQMYGNQPDIWNDDLQGYDRLRLIINYLTRMRFVDKNGRLNLAAKEGIDTAPDSFLPWFEHPSRKAKKAQILFGHWAALEGKTNTDKVWALDTGCVWGGRLTALRLEDKKLFSVPAQPDSK